MATQNVSGQIKLRNDTASNWATENPVLLLGEIGLETDTRKAKIGDGTTAWNGLQYAFTSSASGNYLPLSGGTMTGDITFQDRNRNEYFRMSSPNGQSFKFDAKGNNNFGDGGSIQFDSHNDGSNEIYIDSNGHQNGRAKVVIRGKSNESNQTPEFDFDVGNSQFKIKPNGVEFNNTLVSLDGHTHTEYALSNHTHSDYAASSHNHAASAITSGTLGVARGGTGQTSAVNAANAFLNALSTGSSIPVDADYYISQYVGGGTSTTTYHRRPMSALFSYVTGKQGYKDRTIEYIKGTQTAATASWTGVTKDSALYDGKTIFYYLPYAGVSGTSVTLNLTLSGGGTTGAKAVRYSGTTALTTHYGAGSVVSLTYVQSVDAWCHADYNTNTTYTNMTAAEATTGTATTARSISAKVLHDKIVGTAANSAVYSATSNNVSITLPKSGLYIIYVAAKESSSDNTRFLPACLVDTTVSMACKFDYGNNQPKIKINNQAVSSSRVFTCGLDIGSLGSTTAYVYYQYIGAGAV